MKRNSVFCEVGTELLNTIYTNVRRKGVMQPESHHLNMLQKSTLSNHICDPGQRNRYGDLATGWKIRNSNPGRGKRFLSSPDWIWDPPSLLFNKYRDSYLRAKRPEREVDHSPPSSAEVKNEWSYTSAPPACLHSVDRNNFTVTWPHLSKIHFNKIIHSTPRVSPTLSLWLFHTHTHFSLLSLFIVRPFSPLLLTCTLRSFLQSVVTVSLLGPGIHQHYLPSWKSINWIKTYGRVGAGSQEGYSAVNIKTVAFCNVTSYCLING
jgi:hypothetical protein